MTRSVWLLGRPVAHSVSPAMHKAAYAALGEDLVYLAAEVGPEDLPTVLDGLLKLQAVGINLTIPLKQAVLPLLKRLDQRARELGAVNCLRPCDGGWEGTNTDADGWLDSWREEVGQPLEGRRAIVLGWGGAARAVGTLLQEQGARLQVLLRDPTRLKESAPLHELAKFLEPGTVVLNATPVGTRSDESPVVWPEPMPENVVACDLVYNPQQTRFLQEARQKGCLTLGGLGMLVHQARRAIEWWTGQPADCAAVMRRAAEDQLSSM